MYYSQLSQKKQSEIFGNVMSLKMNILQLESGLQKAIKDQLDLDILIGNKVLFNDMVKGQKVFKYESYYFPINIEAILNKIN